MRYTQNITDKSNVILKNILVNQRKARKRKQRINIKQKIKRKT